MLQHRFDSGDLDLSEMLDEVSGLYKSEPYSNANMWPVTRDWLKQHVTDPSIIIPD